MEMLYNFMYKCVLGMGIWAHWAVAMCKGWAYGQSVGSTREAAAARLLASYVSGMAGAVVSLCTNSGKSFRQITVAL